MPKTVGSTDISSYSRKGYSNFSGTEFGGHRRWPYSSEVASGEGPFVPDTLHRLQSGSSHAIELNERDPHRGRSYILRTIDIGTESQTRRESLTGVDNDLNELYQGKSFFKTRIGA